MTSVAYSQTENFQKSKQYISIATSGFIRTSNVIANSGSRELLKKSNAPGATLGLNYTRISKGGLSAMTGLNFQIVPVGYFFDIPYQEFDVPSSFGNFTENTVDYSIGQFYIPLQLGYTMMENQNWEPAVSFGVNVNYLTSYYVRHRYSATDNSGNDRPTFQLVVTSPNNGAGRLWLTYNATAKLARNLRSGNQVYAGLSANISNLIVHNGSYEFYLKSGTEIGSYTDKGSYIGLQIGYSFLRKPKLNRDSRTRK